MDDELVILVDERDNEIGLMPKTEAHQKAALHRAISVFIFDSKGNWLLQKRALTKYHSAGLWTNTCCTHPLPNENNSNAANRRLLQEMGMQCNLTECFSFTYKEVLDNSLSEHEFDHVFVGISNEVPQINHDEVAEYKYVNFTDLDNDILLNPANYTVWFRKIYQRVYQQTKNFCKK